MNKTKTKNKKLVVTITLVVMTFIFVLCSIWQFGNARYIADNVNNYELHDILGERQGLEAIDVGKNISVTILDPLPFDKCQSFSFTPMSSQWVLCPYSTSVGNLIIALGIQQDDDVFSSIVSKNITGWIQPSYTVYGNNELTTENFLNIWKVDLLDGFLVLHEAYVPDELLPIQKNNLKIATTRYDLQNIAYGIQWLCFAIFTIFLNVRYLRVN